MSEIYACYRRHGIPPGKTKKPFLPSNKLQQWVTRVNSIFDWPSHTLTWSNGGDAADAAKKGLAVGDLKREDTANIMYGMALFNQKKLEQARRAFQAASKDKRSKRAAAQWIKYVDSEIRRRDTLEQKLPELKARDMDEILKANQIEASG